MTVLNLILNLIWSQHTTWLKSLEWTLRAEHLAKLLIGPNWSMFKANRRGPRIEPCGTPQVRLNEENESLLLQTLDLYTWWVALCIVVHIFLVCTTSHSDRTVGLLFGVGEYHQMHSFGFVFRLKLNVNVGIEFDWETARIGTGINIRMYYPIYTRWLNFNLYLDTWSGLGNVNAQYRCMQNALALKCDRIS